MELGPTNGAVDDVEPNPCRTRARDGSDRRGTVRRVFRRGVRQPDREPVAPAASPSPPPSHPLSLPTRTRLAFAGSGTITVLHGLAAQLLRQPVVAVASRNPDHARQRADQLDAVPVTYEELPAGSDLVVIATTPERHADDALRALDGGAAVLIEKPLCSTLADADRLVDASRDGVVAYAENLLHAPAARLALDQIAELCASGPLVNLEATAVQGRPEWGSFLDPERGGGVLFDLGSHPIALVLAAAPTRPVGIRGWLQSSADCPVDDAAAVEIDFEDGLTARVRTSWTSKEPIWDLQAATQDGVVRLEIVPTLSVERDGEELVVAPPSYTEVPQLEQLGYAAQLHAAISDAQHSSHPTFGAAFGRDVLDAVCGAYRSAGRGGETEPLPFTGPRDRTPHQLWIDPPTSG